MCIACINILVCLLFRNATRTCFTATITGNRCSLQRRKVDHIQTEVFGDVIIKRIINPVGSGGLYPNNQACFYTIGKVRAASVLEYIQLPDQNIEQDISNMRCNDCFVYRYLFPNGRSNQFITCGIGIDKNIHGRETPFEIEAEFRSDESVRRTGGVTLIAEYPSAVRTYVIATK